MTEHLHIHKPHGRPCMEMPSLIMAFRRWRQDSEFKTNLEYIVRTYLQKKKRKERKKNRTRKEMRKHAPSTDYRR